MWGELSLEVTAVPWVTEETAGAALSSATGAALNWTEDEWKEDTLG